MFFLICFRFNHPYIILHTFRGNTQHTFDCGNVTSTPICLLRCQRLAFLILKSRNETLQIQKKLKNLNVIYIHFKTISGNCTGHGAGSRFARRSRYHSSRFNTDVTLSRGLSTKYGTEMEASPKWPTDLTVQWKSRRFSLINSI